MLLWCNPLFASDLRLIVDTSVIWEAVDGQPHEPIDEWEILAVKSGKNKATVDHGRLMATYVGGNELFDHVVVEEASEDKSDGVCAVKNFGVCNDKICRESRRQYITKLNPEKEQIARSIAEGFLKDKSSNIKPTLFDGRAYVVDYDGKCSLTVYEKDRSTTYSSYRYSICR